MEKWIIKNTKSNKYYWGRIGDITNACFDTIEHSQLCYSKKNAERIIKRYKMKDCIPVKIRIIYEEVKE